MPDDSATATELFDRCATYTAEWASKPSFFAICVLVVVAWIPTIWALPTVDTWQLVINTVTNIITFLLVALLQNTQSHSDRAVQQKLNAIAEAMGDLMDERRRGSLTGAVGAERRIGSA